MGRSKNDLKNRLVANINLRVAYSLIEDAVRAVENGEFDNESEYYRTAINFGNKVIALQRIKNDPKKQKEFEEKLHQLLKMSDIERTMQTMTDEQLRTVEFIAKNVREKKVQQMIIDIEKH